MELIDLIKQLPLGSPGLPKLFPTLLSLFLGFSFFSSFLPYLYSINGLGFCTAAFFFFTRKTQNISVDHLISLKTT
jgi:hypothetical protein